MSPLVRDWETIARGVMGPLRLPRNPIAMGRFGLRAMRSARGFANAGCDRARAGVVCGHCGALGYAAGVQGSAAAGLMLQIAGHAVGWPLPRGGAQSITDAMVSYLESLGGEVVTGVRVESLEELPGVGVALLDVGARQLASIAGDAQSWRLFRYGPGVFKMDWALEGPIPWSALDCSFAGTVHVGGTLEEIAAAEAAVWRGEHPERPFVLVAQPSMFDDTRAPQLRHVAWAYCHVPNGSDFDMTERIENQIERFAPGFRERILARSVMKTSDIEDYNANYVGGDIAGGANTLRQLFARPVSAFSPYRTPIEGVYLCSASTPPGAGVHGMCGYWAALDALKWLRTH
ncbi:Protein p49 [Geodia barretti]|uniref:Protein p49 n=1 Tax=Geodia barretti TaxID=519541 RepID=A0AA35WU94_GEOBA|nr:Protein p49 [Geodia barretti]